MEFGIWFYESGIKVLDVEWAIYEPVDESIRSSIEAEFASKVKEKTYDFSKGLIASDIGTRSYFAGSQESWEKGGNYGD